MGFQSLLPYLENLYLDNELKDNFVFYIPIYDKAWIISFLILFISQMVDVQYFDGRVSIIGWLLLAGVKCLTEDINNKVKIQR